MGNTFCQTMSACNCFAVNNVDKNEEKPECISTWDTSERVRFAHKQFDQNNIYSISNETFDLAFFNDKNSIKTIKSDSSEYSILSTTAAEDNRIFVDITCTSQEINLFQADSLSLDSGFNSRNMSPRNLIDQEEERIIIYETPNSGLYDFLLSTHSIMFESSLNIDSLSSIIVNKIVQWSKSSLKRVKRTAIKYMPFRKLKQKTETPRKISRLSGLLGFLSGFNLFNRFRIDYSLFTNEQEDKAACSIQTDLNFYSFRQFFMRLYDINFF